MEKTLDSQTQHMVYISGFMWKSISLFSVHLYFYLIKLFNECWAWFEKKMKAGEEIKMSNRQEPA